MLFSRSFLIAALTAPFLAFAQTSTTGANPFTITNAFTATAGQSVEIKWNPTTQGTVTLVLRKGPSNDLDTVGDIASGIPNSGSYTWMVPASAIRGSNYALEIKSDTDEDAVNYSSPFILESSNVAAPSTSATSSVASSSSSASSALTPSAYPSAPGLTIVTTPYHSTTATMTGSTTGDSRSTTATRSSETSSTTGAMSTSSDGDLQATGAPSQTDNAAPRATAMVGLLGAVALGALAL